MIRALFLLWSFLVILCAGDVSANQENMTYLENKQIRIGMDLNKGGAVTWLSSSEHPGNLINSHDLGRQIQMSHYSGPVPFSVPGKEPKKEWTQIGWNPIQTGDAFGNPSRVLTHKNNGKELYIKCIPMHWPLNNVPGECVFESWTTLDGPRVKMRFCFTNKRPDKMWYPARSQELPAIYTISKLNRVMSYVGDAPFTNAPLTHITNDYKAAWPWARSFCTEQWAAMVDDNDWGLGILNSQCVEFHMGLHGKGGSSDPFGGPTTYIAPIMKDIIDHNIIYHYNITLMTGTLTDLRSYFTANADRSLPSWTFATDRQHWFVQNAQDEGVPLKGKWVITYDNTTPRLQSQLRCWQAENSGPIEIRAAWTGLDSHINVRWKQLTHKEWQPDCVASVPIMGDGRMRTLSVPVPGKPGYEKLLVGLAIDLPAKKQGTFTLESVRVTPK